MTKTEFLTMFNRNPMDTLVLVGKKALAADTQDWDALRYVKDQTPEIALAAVTQNGDALRYVNLDIFED